MTGKDSSHDYEYTDSEIIGELEKTPEGHVLNADGPCSAIYGFMERPGETCIFMDDEDAISVCYIDHDQNLEEMNFDKYGWHMDEDDNRTTLTLIVHDRACEGQTNLNFSFKKRDREAVRQMKKIKSEKALIVYFISILYGNLVKYRKHSFALPEGIVQRILD